MTILDVRQMAQWLERRATQASKGEKRDNIRAGWHTFEVLCRDARAVLPVGAMASLCLESEPQTWSNLARITHAIIDACGDAD
jgi:hypothetical protein